ncbi:MAG: hypothetical protein ACFNYB_01945 [Campylobacter sp.]
MPRFSFALAALNFPRNEICVQNLTKFGSKFYRICKI